MFYNLLSQPVASASPGTVTIAVSVGGAPSVVSKVAHGQLEGTPHTYAAATTMPVGMSATEVYTVAPGATLLNDSYTLLDSQGNAVKVSTTGVGVITATCTDVVATINTESAKTMGLEVQNIGANPLSVFDVYARVTPSANLLKVATSSGDYSTPNYPVSRASGAPVTLAAAATAWLFMDVTGFAEVVLKAVSSTGATRVRIHAASKFMQ